MSTVNERMSKDVPEARQRFNDTGYYICPEILVNYDPEILVNYGPHIVWKCMCCAHTQKTPQCCDHGCHN